MNYRYKRAIPDFDLELLNREIEALGTQDELIAAKLFPVQLIIEELVTNIIKYGGQAGQNENIEIRLHTGQGKITLTISDNTAPFNPLEAEEPDITLSAQERRVGGLGLFLVRKKVEALTYENKDGLNIMQAVL